MNDENVKVRPHVVASGPCWIRVGIGMATYEYVLPHPDDVRSALARFRNGAAWKGVHYLKDACIECNRIPDAPVVPHHRKPDLIRIVEVRDMPNDVNPVRVAFNLFCEEKRFGFHFGKIFIYETF